MGDKLINEFYFLEYKGCGGNGKIFVIRRLIIKEKLIVFGFVEIKYLNMENRKILKFWGYGEFDWREAFVV